MTISAPEDDPDDLEWPDKMVTERWRLNSQRARDNDRALRTQVFVANKTAIALQPTPPQLVNAVNALVEALGQGGGFVSTDKNNSPGPILLSLSVGQAQALAAKLNAGPNVLK